MVGSLEKRPLLSTAAMQSRTKLGTVSPSRWHSDSNWQPNTWSGEAQSEMGSRWQQHPWKLLAQVFTPKLGWPSWLPFLGPRQGATPFLPRNKLQKSRRPLI